MNGWIILIICLTIITVVSLICQAYEHQKDKFAEVAKHEIDKASELAMMSGINEEETEEK